jgi:tetratricopeptide (TPR) repeat protein
MGELWVLFGVDGDGAFRDIDNVVDVSVADKIGKYLQQITQREDWGFPMRTSAVAAARAKDLAGQGQALLRAGEIPRAIELLRTATESDPNSVEAYQGLATAYEKLGQAAEAAWAARKATDLASLPTSTSGYRVPNEKITLSASSVLGNWKHYTFEGANLIDDNLWTSWQPVRKPPGGVGEWVLMTFSEPQVVTGFEFSNGFRRLDELGDLYRMNNRIENAVLQLSDGTEFPIHFEDADKEQSFMLPTPVKVESVKLVVKSIYKGSKWNDLAVSEFHALAKE